MIAEMNQTTAALGCLLLVLIVAALSTRRVAVGVSLLVFAGYNFFVLPPVHTFTIAKGDDVVALLALLAVSLIGSQLSHQARERAQAALALERQRDEADMARRSADMKAALVASLGHDLKTPLTALTVATGNLGLPDLPDADRHEQLRIVRDELERLRRLFDSVIELASVEARAMTPDPEWVTPADVIEAAYRQARVDARQHPMRVSADAGQWLVHVDPRIVSAALAHVIENAAAYSPAASPIEIDAAVSGDSLAIGVRDHGAGIPPADLDRVFERFYRSNGETHPFGSGMGLAITRGLLALHGATVSASNHPLGGARFVITIPTASCRAMDTVPGPV